MHQKPRIPPRPKEDGVSCCMMDEEKKFNVCFFAGRGCCFVHDRLRQQG